jgi:hypothetical protein
MVLQEQIPPRLGGIVRPGPSYGYGPRRKLALSDWLSQFKQTGIASTVMQQQVQSQRLLAMA